MRHLLPATLLCFFSATGVGAQHDALSTTTPTGTTPTGTTPTGTTPTGTTQAETQPETTTPTPPRRTLRMVVMELDVDETIRPRTARIVADSIVVELRKLAGVSVVGMAEVRDMLAAEADRQTLGCSEGTSCLAEVADALGADVLITGRIASLNAATTVLSMRRIDQGTATVTGQVEERLVAAGGDELLAAVGPAIEKLFPDVAVKPGQSRGVPPETARVLNPPPLPVWSTLGIAGGAVAVAVAGVAVGALSAQAFGSAQALVDQSATAAIEGSLVARQEADAANLAVVANVAFAGAAGLAVVAGVMALFTDWSGLASAAP